jgi:hypothetical protein
MPQEVQWHGTGVLQEQPNSPRWSYAETVQATQIFRGLYELARASALRKGTLGLGQFVGMRVASSTVEHERGGVGTLTIVWEGLAVSENENEGDVQMPPDEIDVSYEQQELDIRKHPYFAALTSSDLAGAKAYVEAGDPVTLAELQSLGGDSLVNDLILRLQRGQENYVVYAPVIRHTSFFLNPPALDGGGYVDFPSIPGGAPSGWQYLRAGDSMSWNGSFYKLTRSWQAAPSWDNLLYA